MLNDMKVLWATAVASLLILVQLLDHIECHNNTRWVTHFVVPSSSRPVAQESETATTTATARALRDIPCPGQGHFSSLSFCYVRCVESKCSAANDLCAKLAPLCEGGLRSERGMNASLSGQLIRLINFGNASSFSSRRAQMHSCEALGAAVSSSPLGSRVRRIQYEKEAVRKAFYAGNGTLLYLHFRKNAGSTMCELAKRNGMRVPANEKGRVPMPSSMGKNCNPGYREMHAWWGTREQQLQWVTSNRIQYYGHEVHLSRPEDIPFDRFMLGANLRHPLTRQFSLYVERSIKVNNTAPDVLQQLQVSLDSSRSKGFDYQDFSSSL